MPSRTSVYNAAAQVASAKGLLGFLKSSVGSSRRWIGQSTVRALGDTGSPSRRSPRRPVVE